MDKELITGIPNAGHCVVFKSPKEGQKTFKVTQQLLSKLWTTSKNVNNKGVVMLTIPKNKKENFVLKCYLTTEKRG